MVVAATHAERDTLDVSARPERQERLASISGFAPGAEGPLPFPPPHPHDHPAYRGEHHSRPQPQAQLAYHGQPQQRQEQPQAHTYAQPEDPDVMPRHLRRAAAAAEDDGEVVPFSDRAFRTMWPTITGLIILFSAFQMYNVWHQSADKYDIWANASVMLITVGSIGAMMILYKWILRGPDGRPS